MMTVRRFNSLLLLALLTVSGSSSRKVVGRAGEDVTLPCKYNIKSNGPRAVCWNQGSIPTSGCNNQIISTDGSKVTTRASSRYQLLGRLEDGDVSLTILNTTEEGAGLYGCRVDIFGWFNDQKHHIDLTIEKAPSTTSTPTTETTEHTTNTSGQVTATWSLPTSSNSIDPERFQSGATISHLLYMDDIKLYVRNAPGMDSLIHITRIYRNHIRLKCGGTKEREEDQNREG
ncbi:T-cell immunoglobulin and mucin domain-containing protein 4-like [Scomber scombrus]|uniref:T-cell immunoglobulin and mucin domain-containing protein 4-like n=1 Tax=Scomber scombrus TaxID=13677 RepID=UPI002DDAE1DA|nr:T-cell immunoglobulin and mucin domain-containing protein 4-like [Scomber scombrus]